MYNLYLRLRDLVWTSVIAVALTVASIIVAIISPDSVALVVALGLGAVAMAGLSQRA